MSSEEEAMNGFTMRRIDELTAINHGALKLAGDELGVESFGLQVLDLPAEFADYPEHDHAHDGQEEIYVVLEGTAEFAVAGECHPGRCGHARPGRAASRHNLRGALVPRHARPAQAVRRADRRPLRALGGRPAARRGATPAHPPPRTRPSTCSRGKSSCG